MEGLGSTMARCTEYLPWLTEGACASQTLNCSAHAVTLLRERKYLRDRIAACQPPRESKDDDGDDDEDEARWWPLS